MELGSGALGLWDPGSTLVLGAIVQVGRDPIRDKELSQEVGEVGEGWGVESRSGFLGEGAGEGQESSPGPLGGGAGEA